MSRHALHGIESWRRRKGRERAIGIALVLIGLAGMALLLFGGAKAVTPADPGWVAKMLQAPDTPQITSSRAASSPW